MPRFVCVLLGLVGFVSVGGGQTPALPKPWKEPPPLAEVLKRVRDKDPQVRLQALETIAAHSWLTYSQQPKEVVPILLETLADDNVLIRRLTAETLHYYGSDPRVLRALITALRDRDQGPPYDSTVAQCAADSLGVMGAQATAALPGLLELARTGDWFSGPAATLALGEIAAKDASAVPEVVLPLGKLLQDEKRHPRARAAAAKALGIIGAKARGALPALRAVIRNRKLRPDPWQHDVRRDALQTLARMGPAAAEAVPDLLAVLQSEGETDPEKQERSIYRAEAARTLGHLEAKASPAIPVLRKAAREKDVSVEIEAREALYRIEPLPDPDPLPGLLKDLRDSRVEVRIKATETILANNLRRFRHRTGDLPQLISALLQASEDESAAVRRRALMCVACYQAEKRVLSRLIAALQDPDPGIPGEISVAQQATGSFAPHSKPRLVVPLLMELVRNGRRYLPGEAIRSLGGVARGNRVTKPYIVSFLVAICYDNTHPQRAEAMSVLSRLGPAGRAIIPLLVAKLDSGQGGFGFNTPYARGAVVGILGSIGSGYPELQGKRVKFCLD